MDSKCICIEIIVEVRLYDELNLILFFVGNVVFMLFLFIMKDLENFFL